MKPLYNIINYKFRYLIILILILATYIEMNAQLQVPFTQRTSLATPSKTIYNVKGDFTMLGNTNLTLATYLDGEDNDNPMIYVDVDSDSNTLNSSSATLEFSTENGADPLCSTIIFAGLYWTGKSTNNQYTSTTAPYYDKRKVSLKGPLESTYTTIIAADTDIWYPGSGDDGIFVGYKEITDYVKTNGVGEYFVADLALSEGTGPTPGYSGGWGMIVVYENSLMKSRDVTIFDGYAYVDSGNSGTIPISGFTAVLSGDVQMKLGVMVSEGDRNRTGDYLKIQELNTANYLSLSHTGNTTTNFYNSSIETGGNPRNPNLLNNTGIDLSMFNVPNTGNTIIANGQTSTNFQYGSSADKFSIFGFAMAVDAYVPKPEGIIDVNSINGVPNPSVLTVLPGQVIEYSLDITNNGTEATSNTLVTIPIPETSIFETGSISFSINSPLVTPNAPYYDATANEILWDIGDLPIVEGDPNFLLGTLTFQLKITEDCAILINAGCSPEISLDAGTITGNGSISGVPFTEYFFQGYDNSSGCDVPINGSIVVAIDTSSSACFNSFAGPNQIASCGGETVTLNATNGTIGTWSIVSGPSGGGEIFSDNTSPSSDFYSANIGLYTLRWTTSCAATTDDVLVTLENCNIIDFDGSDDNINFTNIYNLNSDSFSLETWIKSNATNGDIQTIISKRFGSSLIDGYDLRLVNNTISFNWNNGNSITSTNLIGSDRWYHIAVTFNGSAYNLYIDGIAVQTPVSGSNPIQNNSVDCIVGAMDQNSAVPVNYFNGWIDEIRIWNVELTVDQIRQMMNQEIQNVGGNVRGSSVPIDITGLNWSNLEGYYQMDQINDISNGYLLDKSASVANGKLKNIYSPQQDTAPLPYISTAGTDWDLNTTWLNGTVQSIPNTIGVDGITTIDWNIVETNHNVNTNRNVKVLGLISNANELSINANNSLEISNYLLLNGVIDLDGESQLIQTTNSILDESSSGYIEQDQQGTANSFNYNYWSSSVGPIEGGVGSNNADQTISGVLLDGTVASSPLAITFLPDYAAADAGIVSPIKISTYWLYKFNGTNNDYNSWTSIDQNTLLKAGEGYTMKGSSGGVSITTNQNYVFKGKPHNGDITLSIAADNDRLIGNPYPSALDANEFILDNISVADGGRNTVNVFNGALYFWDHFGQENSHILREYAGGYATYTLMGGAKAYSNDARINNNGSIGTKLPKRYIPVNQGFFVAATIDSVSNSINTGSFGGNIVFKNSQRTFMTETSGNSLFMKSSGSKKVTNQIKTEEDTRLKIRLLFDSSTGYHRQLLVGVDEKASNSFDLGYDAFIADVGDEDMFWVVDGAKFVIQAVNNFNKDQELPLGIVIKETGLVKIKVDTLENIDDSFKIYIKDNLTGETHKINNQPFEINLEAGEYFDRFTLTFQPRLKTVKDVALRGGIDVYMNNNISELQIIKIVDTDITSVSLFNYLGQQIKIWGSGFNERFISLPIKINTGVYIVQINTKNGMISKKIIRN